MSTCTRVRRGERVLILTLGSLALLVAGVGRAEEVLIPREAVWSYLDDGSDPGTAWRRVDFRESWPTGRAELGFGDAEPGAEGTVIEHRGMTCYFRHAFQLSEAQVGRIEGIRLRVRRDDGVVVYLNGEEIYRLGVDMGPVSYRDEGTTTYSEDHFYRWYVDAEHLRAGTNLVAVEMHKANERDDDLSFDLELVGTTGEVEIWRGPYLQRATPHGVTLRFTTSVAVAPTLRLGSDPKTGTETRIGSQGVDHLFRLDGLRPDTRYYYTILLGERVLAGGDDVHWFRTHPEHGTDRPTRIWVIGDAGDGRFSKAESMLAAYQRFTGSTETDVWLMLGDNAYKHGSLMEYQDGLFDMFAEPLRHTVAWPLIGNHDRRAFTEHERPYFDLFTLPTEGESGGVPSGSEFYYSFDHGDIHFVALYGEKEGLASGSPQLDWLERDLEASDAAWTIAFVHIAPYATGEHNSDRVERHLNVRENALPILERHGVDLVLSGHSHCYQRSYLIRGHYGPSTSWNPKTHLVDGGDGCPDDERVAECSGGGDGAYTDAGTVYVIVGNSSRPTERGPLDHPVVAYGRLHAEGSMVIDIDGDRLEARALLGDGTIADRFVILHGAVGATATVKQARRWLLPTALGLVVLAVFLGLRLRRTR